MNLTLDDFAVRVSLGDQGTEGVMVAVRRLRNGLEIAGTWD